jgi:small nuclear ribonucleoprotein (snRNP)-like protein
MRDFRTLPSTLLTACLGCRIVVELKTGVTISGLLDSTDSNLNMTLGKCELEMGRKGEAAILSEFLFINGGRVRCLYLDGINIESQLKKAWTIRQRNGKRHLIVNRRKHHVETQSKNPRCESDS